MIACSADAQALILSVGAQSEFGTLDNVEFESVGVAPFLAMQRIYLCYRKRADGDLVVGERVLGVDNPVTKITPDKVIHKIVLSLDNTSSRPRVTTQFFEFPKELYRDLTDPFLGPKHSRMNTKLAIVNQTQYLTVFMRGGDGAGSYKVNWVIDVKEHKVRRLDAPGERDSVFKDGPWVQMKEISAPKIVLSTKK